MTLKLTEAQVKALRFYADSTDGTCWPATFAWTTNVALKDRGLLKWRITRERSEYNITPLGRAALAAIDKVQP